VSVVAVVVLDSSSLLRSLSVSGHAECGTAGNDVVCAAVTVLVRTAWVVLADKPYITANFLAPVPGELYLDVACKREGEPYLSAVQDFLLEGLQTLAGEFPACLEVVYAPCEDVGPIE
jgi:uncharacterized protein YsxB (DUF464 family)